MRKLLVNMLLYLVVSLILAGVIAFGMTHFYGYEFLNTIFWIGLIIFAVGAMSSISGDPTGGNGVEDPIDSFVSIETQRLERESNNYFSNLKKQAVFEPKVSGLSIIIAGVLLVLISYFLS